MTEVNNLTGVRKSTSPSRRKSKRRRPNKLDGARKLVPVTGMITKQKHRMLPEVLAIIFKDKALIPKFEESVNKTIDWFNSLIRDRGVTAGTKYFNDTRMYTLKLLIGVPTTEVKTLSLHKDGFPADLAHLKVFKSEDKFLQIVYTILSLPRLTSAFAKKFDAKSIVKQPDRTFFYKDEISKFDAALPKILDELQITRGRDPKSLGKNLYFHHTTSKGPNSRSGLDALGSSHLDALAILKDSKVSWAIQSYLKFLDRLDVYDYITRLGAQYVGNDDSGLVCSRIARLPQPGNKERDVAIIDYFSQASLLPLHRLLFEETAKVGNTYVFDQDKGRELVREFTEDSAAMPQSYDASAFTDRFPMEVQEVVIKHMFNADFARSVRHLLTNRDFKVPNGKRSTITYGAGQPMGAFSSFPLANLTHSLYVYWKCSINGEDPVTHSAVVGDDVCLRTLESGTEYKMGMERLGVSFSDLKGYSTTTSSIRVAEFCKRLYVNGTDYSPISPKAVTKAAKDFKFANAIHHHLDDDGFREYLLRTPDRWRKEALMLFSLPDWVTGINKQVDPDLESLKEFKLKLEYLKARPDSLKNIAVSEIALFALEQITKRKSALAKISKDFFKHAEPEVIATHISVNANEAAFSKIYPDLSGDSLPLASFLAEASSKSGSPIIADEVSPLHPLVVVAADLLAFDVSSNHSKIMSTLRGDSTEIPMGPVCSLYTKTATGSIDEQIALLKELAVGKDKGLMPLPLMERETANRDAMARVSYAVGKRIIKRIMELDISIQ